MPIYLHRVNHRPQVLKSIITAMKKSEPQNCEKINAHLACISNVNLHQQIYFYKGQAAKQIRDLVIKLRSLQTCTHSDDFITFSKQCYLIHVDLDKNPKSHVHGGPLTFILISSNFCFWFGGRGDEKSPRTKSFPFPFSLKLKTCMPDSTIRNAW